MPQAHSESNQTEERGKTKQEVPDQPFVRTTVWSARRVKVRYAFEFFQDQIFRLKELRRSALLEDEDFSMSDVVRKALDSYLRSIGG